MPTYSEPPVPRGGSERPSPPPRSTVATQRDIDIRMCSVSAAARIVATRPLTGTSGAATLVVEIAHLLEQHIKTGTIK